MVPGEFVEIKLTGTGYHTGKCDDLLRNIMNDACGCPRETQVIKESMRLVLLTEFCPRHNNE